MALDGKIEVKIKINEFPKETRLVKNGWREFFVNAEGQRVGLKVRPRIWRKMQEANEQFPQWTAAITGKIGHPIKDGFALLEPAVQVYEKKERAPQSEKTVETTQSPPEKTE
jgi:predicted DNA-binding transcriptional regulator AlpA